MDKGWDRVPKLEYTWGTEGDTVIQVKENRKKTEEEIQVEHK